MIIIIVLFSLISITFSYFSFKNELKVPILRTWAAKSVLSKKKLPPTPEFSRIINVNQIPEKRPVLCKILAKEKERGLLAERFYIPELTYFAANVTLSKADSKTINVFGTIEAHVRAGELLDADIIQTDFDTQLLNNYGVKSGVSSFDDETDYDDEVNENGDVDIGEIAAQYLSMEIF